MWAEERPRAGAPRGDRVQFCDGRRLHHAGVAKPTVQQWALVLDELSQRSEQPRLHCGCASVGIVAVQLSRRTGNLEQSRGVGLCSMDGPVHEKLSRK